MTVAPEKAAGKVEHAGKTYYFCSKSCAERFSREPEKFLAVPGRRDVEGDAGPAEHGAIHPSQAAESR
ncbi:MAG TPA: YHS domain-containing protein, partial [Candidatus Binatus sp.]|nr:YHS domain-containing protein [Candidatus Binatus sp.]